MKHDRVDLFLSLAIYALYAYLVYYSWKHPDKAIYIAGLIFSNRLWSKLSKIENHLLAIREKLND